jgi:uncharacterized protein with PQ loop repeat
MTDVQGAYLTQVSIWVSLSLYFFALLPQIVLNYRLKSGTGLSDLYLWAFFSGYITEIFYVFFLDLPLPYKVFVPLGAVCIAFMVGQRFYYGGDHLRRLAVLYSATMVALICTTPLMIRNPLAVGHVTGWIATIVWSVYQLPQMVKIYRTQSVRGFSFTFATVCGIASMLELGVATILPIPVQTQVNAVRGILYYIVFLVQFFLYRS